MPDLSVKWAGCIRRAHGVVLVVHSKSQLIRGQVLLRLNIEVMAPWRSWAENGIEL